MCDELVIASPVSMTDRHPRPFVISCHRTDFVVALQRALVDNLVQANATNPAQTTVRLPLVAIFSDSGWTASELERIAGVLALLHPEQQQLLLDKASTVSLHGSVLHERALRYSMRLSFARLSLSARV